MTRPATERKAKGKPGKKPTWSSGAKTLVGSAASTRSRLWYTIGPGTLNEIYYPDVDQANTRSVRFLVTGENGFFSDEAWDVDYKVSSRDGVPCCQVDSTCKRGFYTLTKEIITDPVRDALLMRVRFVPRRGLALKLYLFADPHIADMGEQNNAWVGEYKGRQSLFAQRSGTALAMLSSPAMKRASCGYIGNSDGYTLLSKGKPLTGCNVAPEGNVGLTAEMDYSEEGTFTVALAFGDTPAEAAQQAGAGIFQPFEKTRDLFTREWQHCQGEYADLKDLSNMPLDLYRISTAVLEMHQSKRFPGGFVASLSTPWGFARGDKDIGGYHLLWPRDLVETAMGKLASGDAKTARSTLFYLRCTQEATGGWSQNMWLDGTPHWGAIQMDGVALPILLADQLRREDALDGYDALPMVRDAVRFLLSAGPYTGQGRWEELSGFSPYTMATQVAALLAAAELADLAARHDMAEFLRQTADAWHDAIDEFTYVTGTGLARQCDVDGYYIRMAPPQRVRRAEIGSLFNIMANLPFGQKHQRAAEVTSPDALALVRFGLRAAGDPRILNTIRVIDETLRSDMTTGTGWARSTSDGYGETAKGKPFVKHGIGRCWPLLAGERGHYELAAGNRDAALELLRTMARQGSECGMLPEQVWNAPDLPEHQLFNGHPTGSGMPLVWAHAEYIKLLRSLHSNAVWDLPPQTVQRYQVEKQTADFQIWTPTQRRGWLAGDKALRIDLPAAATIAWQAGPASGSLQTQDSGLGLHYAMLPITEMGSAAKLRFHLQPQDEKAGDLLSQTFFVRRTLRSGG